jgi:CubicO group peptidase (beta-lactamase class C family)
MSTKIIAFFMSVLSIFAVWNWYGQPNNIPETRVPSFEGELAPDKYGVWPTKAFTEGEKPLWLSTAALEALFPVAGLVVSGTHTSSLLVLHKGELVYERYADGVEPDSPLSVASVTKSVLSALVGIAIGEGYIAGVDQKVIDFFPEAEAMLSPGQESKRDMTVEHLLTMTSGLGDLYTSYEGFLELVMQPDIGLACFLGEQVNPPGTKYYYGWDAMLLGAVLSRAIGRDLFAYAKEKLFDPLGMDSVDWMLYGRNGLDEDGKVMLFGEDNFTYSTSSGLLLSPRDMLRFGYLYLNEGRWEDRQIIPADWVTKTPPRAKTPLSYGYLFHNNMLLPFSGAYEATGACGQWISVLPFLDTVIVRTGEPGPVDMFIWDIENLF